MFFVNTRFLSPCTPPEDLAESCHILFCSIISLPILLDHKHALGCYFLLQLNCFHTVGYTQLWGNRWEINLTSLRKHSASSIE